MKQDEYYESIRSRILDNEVTKRVKDYSKRLSDLDTYLYVGHNLSEAGKHYGEGIIKKYSIELTKEFGKGYTETNLRYFRQFYLFSKCHSLSDKLSYTHYRVLMSINNEDKISYYIHIATIYNLSVRELQTRIKNMKD